MRAALALALLLAGSGWAQDKVWRWVDDKGEESFTNDKNTIPEKYRAKATITEGEALSELNVRNGLAPEEPKAALETPPSPKPLGPTKVSIVFFGASTNSATKVLKKSGVLDKLLANNPGLKFEEVEFGNAVERAEKLKVTQLPTVLFVDEKGVERGRFTGLGILSQLQKELDRAREAAK